MLLSLYILAPTISLKKCHISYFIFHISYFIFHNSYFLSMTGYGVAFPRFMFHISYFIFHNSYFITMTGYGVAFPRFIFPTGYLLLLKIKCCSFRKIEICIFVSRRKRIFWKIWLFSGSQNTFKASTGRLWTTVKTVQTATYQISYSQNILFSTILTVIFHWWFLHEMKK